MDEALKKSGDWPNVAITPGTRRHAATGEPVEQPENTRIGRSRGACRPDDADCESEPARVENRPQDGSECDTREQLEADIRRAYWCLSEQEIGPVFAWLDRQAAITRRETRQSWQDAPNVLDRTNLRTIAELTAECDKLQAELEQERIEWEVEYDHANLCEKRLKELTAERDKLKAKLETYGKVPDQGEREESQPVESGDTRENLEVDMFYAVTRLWNEAYKLGSRNGVGGFKIDEPFYKLLDRQAAITERKTVKQWEEQASELVCEVNKLTAERDSLRSRLKTQANSFQKLERDNARLRDTLAQVRELVGDVE